MSWLLEELEAAFWIIVGVLMLGGTLMFGEFVSGQYSRKKKDPKDPS